MGYKRNARLSHSVNSMRPVSGDSSWNTDSLRVATTDWQATVSHVHMSLSSNKSLRVTTNQRRQPRRFRYCRWNVGRAFDCRRRSLTGDESSIDADPWWKAADRLLIPTSCSSCCCRRNGVLSCWSRSHSTASACSSCGKRDDGCAENPATCLNFVSITELEVQELPVCIAAILFPVSVKVVLHHLRSDGTSVGSTWSGNIWNACTALAT